MPGRALLWLALGMWCEYYTAFVGAAFGVVWLLAPREGKLTRADVRDCVLFALSTVGLGLYLWWSIGLTNFGHTDPFLPAGEPIWTGRAARRTGGLADRAERAERMIPGVIR